MGKEKKECIWLKIGQLKHRRRKSVRFARFDFIVLSPVNCVSRTARIMKTRLTWECLMVRKHAHGLMIDRTLKQLDVTSILRFGIIVQKHAMPILTALNRTRD